MCPQFGVWTDGPMNANVFCKSSGVDQDDACENDPCSENAICIDQFEVLKSDLKLEFQIYLVSLLPP